MRRSSGRATTARELVATALQRGHNRWAVASPPILELKGRRIRRCVHNVRTQNTPPAPHAHTTRRCVHDRSSPCSCPPAVPAHRAHYASQVLHIRNLCTRVWCVPYRPNPPTPTRPSAASTTLVSAATAPTGSAAPHNRRRDRRCDRSHLAPQRRAPRSSIGGVCPVVSPISWRQRSLSASSTHHAARAVRAVRASTAGPSACAFESVRRGSRRP